jgi:hypothetical protein
MSNRQMARDMQVEFQARFQAKQARREAQKAAKQDPILKKQIQDLLKKGETQKAYQKAKMLLSKQALAQQMDQMADMAELSAAQIQANNSMNRMTQMMAQSSRTMNVAQKNTNPEKVGVVSSLSRRFKANNLRRPSLPSSNSSSKTKNTPCPTASTKTPSPSLPRRRLARMLSMSYSESWLMTLALSSARSSTKRHLQTPSLCRLMSPALKRKTSFSRGCEPCEHSCYIAEPTSSGEP